MQAITYQYIKQFTRVLLLSANSVASGSRLGATSIGRRVAGGWGRRMEARTIHSGTNHSVVHLGSALGLRQLEPQNKDGLESIVPGDIVQHNAKRKRLEIGQEPKNDPVREPEGGLVRLSRQK